MQMDFKACNYKRQTLRDNIREMLLIEKWWEMFIPVRPAIREYSELIIPSKL